MPAKFEFAYNLERDLENWKNSVISWRRPLHGNEGVQEKVVSRLPQEIRKGLSGAETDIEKLDIIRKYLERNRKEKANYYQEKIGNLSEAWANIQAKAISRLEKLFEKPLDFDLITVNPTTLPIRPYNFQERYLMVSFDQEVSDQLRTIIHELFHFMTHAHYDSYLRDKIGGFQHYEMVKEALTVFINSDFQDLGVPEDKGYPKERGVREKLLEIDRSEKSFEEVLDEAVALTKELL